MPLLGREPGTQVYRELEEHPGDETFPGIGVVRLDSGLFFATAEALDNRVRAVIRTASRLPALVLDLEGVDFIDSQGAAKLTSSSRSPQADGVTLRLARVKPQVLAHSTRTGMVAGLGDDHVTATSTRRSKRSSPKMPDLGIHARAGV